MADNGKASGDKQQAGDPPPPESTVDGEGQGGGDGAGGGQQPPPDKGRNALAVFRELNTNERLTALLAVSGLLVAIGSLAVSYLTYRTASDTRDIKRAVSGLANLATQASIQAAQTKRQADTMASEMGEMRRQADNTGKLVDPATRSANAAVYGVKIQEKNFLADERPRLSFDEDTHGHNVYPQLDSQGRIFWNFNIKNYGKSPAAHLRDERFMRIGDEPFVKSPRIDSSLQVLATKGFWGTVYYRGPVSTEIQKAAVQTNSPSITIKIVLRYGDEFGGAYTETLCAQTLESGAIANCQEK